MLFGVGVCVLVVRGVCVVAIACIASRVGCASWLMDSGFWWGCGVGLWCSVRTKVALKCLMRYAVHSKDAMQNAFSCAKMSCKNPLFVVMLR